MFVLSSETPYSDSTHLQISILDLFLDWNTEITTSPAEY